MQTHRHMHRQPRADACKHREGERERERERPRGEKRREKLLELINEGALLLLKMMLKLSHEGFLLLLHMLHLRARVSLHVYREHIL